MGGLHEWVDGWIDLLRIGMGIVCLWTVGSVLWDDGCATPCHGPDGPDSITRDSLSETARTPRIQRPHTILIPCFICRTSCRLSAGLTTYKAGSRPFE